MAPWSVSESKEWSHLQRPPIIELPCLNPQEELNVSVNLESPIPSGEYQSQWRLCNSDGAVCGGVCVCVCV